MLTQYCSLLSVQPSSEPSVSYKLFTGGGSCLSVDENEISAKHTHKKRSPPIYSDLNALSLFLSKCLS